MSEYAEITLDGCCSEGGGARGLVQAGHYVVGVDIDPSCREGYLRSGAHEFVCASILDVLQDKTFLSRFTFTTQHPPCQGYSGMSHCRPGLAGTYARLIRPVHMLLEANWGGRPYVIENVWGARGELPDPVVMCMWMFGRRTYRHRVLWPGGGLRLIPPSPPPAPDSSLRPGIKLNRECGWPHPVPTARAGHWEPGMFVSVAGHERKQPVFGVMEIDLHDRRTGTGWMSSRDRIKEAIPPYLGRWIAEQLAAWREEQETTAA